MHTETIVPEIASPVKSIETTRMLRAQRARTLAGVHDSVCWAKRQGLRCSTCFDLNARAARLEANRG